MELLRNFQVYPNDKFIKFLSSKLQRIVKTNHWTTVETARMSAFDILTSPSISIQSYLEGIVRNWNCSLAYVVVAYIYLGWFLKHQQPSFAVNSFNVHRLILTRIMVMAKFMDGIHCSNGHYAKIGAIKTTKLMNDLEKHYLFGLKFRLYIIPSDFYSYADCLHKEMVFESPRLPRVPIADKSRKRKCSCSEDHCAPKKQLQQLADRLKIV